MPVSRSCAFTRAIGANSVSTHTWHIGAPLHQRPSDGRPNSLMCAWRAHQVAGAGIHVAIAAGVGIFTGCTMITNGGLFAFFGAGR